MTNTFTSPFGINDRAKIKISGEVGIVQSVWFSAAETQIYLHYQGNDSCARDDWFKADQLEPAGAEETTFGPLLAATSEIKSFDLSEMLAPVTHAIERIHHDIIGARLAPCRKFADEIAQARAAKSSGYPQWAVDMASDPKTPRILLDELWIIAPDLRPSTIVPSPIGVEFEDFPSVSDIAHADEDDARPVAAADRNDDWIGATIDRIVAFEALRENPNT